MGRLKELWAELSKPMIEQMTLQDALEELMYYICIVEGIHNLEDRKKYIKFILERSGSFSGDEIEQIISLAR